MTEADALTKWCPFSRVIVRLDGSTFPPHNRVAALDSKPYDEPDDVPGALCIGSACMAWRWDYVVDQETPRFDPTAPDLYKHSTTDGYCGLAGKP
jgi:hypothetical protein